jgi:hypothetical protein
MESNEILTQEQIELRIQQIYQKLTERLDSDSKTYEPYDNAYSEVKEFLSELETNQYDTVLKELSKLLQNNLNNNIFHIFAGYFRKLILVTSKFIDLKSGIITKEGRQRLNNLKSKYISSDPEYRDELADLLEASIYSELPSIIKDTITESRRNILLGNLKILRELRPAFVVNTNQLIVQ